MLPLCVSGPGRLSPGPSKMCGTPTSAEQGDQRQVQTGAGHGHSCLLPEAGALLGLSGGSCSQEWKGLSSDRILPACACLPERAHSCVPSAHSEPQACPTATGMAEGMSRGKEQWQNTGLFPSPLLPSVVCPWSSPCLSPPEPPSGRFCQGVSHEPSFQPRELQPSRVPLCSFLSSGRDRVVEDSPRKIFEGLWQKMTGEKWHALTVSPKKLNYEIITSNRDVFYKWVVNISQTGIWAMKDVCLAFLHATVIFYLNYRKPRNVPCFKRFSITFSIAERPLSTTSLPLALPDECSSYYCVVI